MALPELQQAFINNLGSEGTIIISRDSLQPSAATNISDVVSDLENYLDIEEGETLQITGVSKENITLTGNTLTILNGTTSFLDANMFLPRMIFKLNDQKEISLAFQTTDLKDKEGQAWQLYSSFPSLFVFSQLDGQLDQPSMLFSSPSTETWNHDGKTLSLEKGLNFYTKLLSGTPALALAHQLLGNIFEIKDFEFYLFGVIDLTSPKGDVISFPTIDLKCDPRKTEEKKLGPISVQNPMIGLRTIQLPEDPEVGNESSPEFYFGLDIPFDSGKNALEFQASLAGQADFLIFSIKPHKGVTLEFLCESIMQMKKEEFQSSIPEPLQKGLETIAFKGLSATLFLTAKLPKLSTITTRLGSTKPLNFGPFEEANFFADWTVLFYDKPTHLLDFGAEFEIADIGNFDVEISVQ